MNTQCDAVNHSNYDGRALRVSVNPRIVDKNIHKDTNAFANGWIACELSLLELREQIDQGYAFSAQFKLEVRKSSNFLAADFLAIDVDGTMSLGEARKHVFLRQYGSLLYTTPSHQKDGQDRFRVVFVTPRTVTSRKEWEAGLRGIADILNSDRSATDAARLFFGSKGAAPEILGRQLSNEAFEEVVARGKAIAKKAPLPEVDGEGALVSVASSGRSDTRIGVGDLISCYDGRVAVLGNIPPRTRVYCPNHADDHPSAFTVRSKSGVPGLHCSTCQLTYWLEGELPPPYNFYDFDNRVEALAATSQRTEKQVFLHNERYLPSISLVEGAVFIKSPKGTGKTNRIQEIVELAKAANRSVLVIGHRQALLKELAKRLKLACYLDDSIPMFFGKPKPNEHRPDHYAVCLDSLAKRLTPFRPYDIVILDECEQVLSHAMSETIRDPVQVLNTLQRYVTSARSLYLLDADLNRVTSHFVLRSRGQAQYKSAQFHLNRFVENGRAIELFSSATHLMSDLISSARAGKRLFVACNSKRRAKILARMLADAGIAGINIMLITADEKADERVQSFLTDIQTKMLSIDVLIASPAIGTGIDITFPNDAALVDVVYGFFEAGINSHYDCDQQIGRVRNPSAVKVWISPRRFNFEIDSQAVKHDLVERGDAMGAITSYSGGNPVYNPNHPLLCLQAEVYCAQRASQNDLKRLFVAHKERNGWSVVNVKTEKAPEDSVAAAEKSREELDEERITGLLSAEPIDHMTYRALTDRRDDGGYLSRTEFYQVGRFEMEGFYGSEISRSLIERDGHGHLQVAIEAYESLHIHSPLARSNAFRLWSDVKAGCALVHSGSSRTRLVTGALIESGLLVPERLLADRVFTGGELRDFKLFCEKYATTLERDLGLIVRKDLDRDPIKMLNKILETVGLRARKVGTKRVKSAKTYFYQIDCDELAFLEEVRLRRKSLEDRGKKLIRRKRNARHRGAVEFSATTIMDFFGGPANDNEEVEWPLASGG